MSFITPRKTKTIPAYVSVKYVFVRSVAVRKAVRRWLPLRTISLVGLAVIFGLAFLGRAGDDFLAHSSVAGLVTILFPQAQAANQAEAVIEAAIDAEIAAAQTMLDPGQLSTLQSRQDVIDTEIPAADSVVVAGQSRINAGRLGGLRAVIKARRQAMLSSQLSARILEIGPEDGERFKKGRILVTFDCGDFKAQLDRAQAELSAAEEKYASTDKLNRMGGISNLDVSMAKASMQSAKADMRAAAWKVNRCQIKAPYDGRVVERIANRYETVNMGDDIMSIVSDSDLEVRVIMPSAWLRKVGMGTFFSFNLEETGQSYEAEVVATGATIDPVSQTVEMRGRILSAADNVISGMSGSALFNELVR